jgi:hypothetical protein
MKFITQLRLMLNPAEGVQHLTSRISEETLAAIDGHHPLSVGIHVKMDLILPLDKFKKLGRKRSRVDVSGSLPRLPIKIALFIIAQPSSDPDISKQLIRIMKYPDRLK